MRGPAVVVNGTTAAGCASDFDVDVDLDLKPAQRATIRRGRLDPVNFGAQRLGRVP
jgi:hypothetical protein